MNDRNEMVLVLPDETLKTLGIDEDTLFETCYENGRIIIRILDEDDLDEDEDYEDGDIPEECFECPHFCWHYGVCTLDKERD